MGAFAARDLHDLPHLLGDVTNARQATRSALSEPNSLRRHGSDTRQPKVTGSGARREHAEAPPFGRDQATTAAPSGGAGGRHPVSRVPLRLC